ncbi:MAG: DUF4263 domain-containing protein [bacterium]|nr:DUF4263 domain-containing protein [bacterium]
MDSLHQHLTEIGDVQLRWNVVGVGADGVVDPEKFAVHIFAVDFAKAKAGFDAPLSATEISKLHDFLAPFAEQLSVEPPSVPLRIVEADGATNALLQLIEGLDKPGLGNILSALHKSGKFEWLAQNLDRVESEELEAALRHSRRRRAIEHLKRLVSEDEKGDVIALCKGNEELSAYTAGKPETVFQRWFEANTWVLGREYIRRHPLRVIGLDSEADLVMETVDGFLDLVELKRPRAKLLASKPGGPLSTGFHYPHSDLAQAYGQCVRYLDELDGFRDQLERKYKARIVAPRVFLILGRSHEQSEDWKGALRRIASTFHQIEVLSYDQVVDTGETLLAHGSGEPDTLEV